ncbi:hypothetical protein KGM_205362 [Danaus plexippus plexippus]|uniref:Arrestin-like N-terminal domain-containing protein n=1 Tax=Danaus plexippus plexippus TaxID=278856 RepID=A0A212F037_DANPL|nr:hypothetical protein KGM_205362 [Danaus plexippus plexippus]
MQLLNNLTGTDVPIMTAVMGTQREELQSAIITLNEPNAVYYSGQLIKGNLNFELNKPLHYIAINIQYVGECNVFWIEEQIEVYNGVKQKKHIKYEGREEYFNVIHCLSGGDGGTCVLATGPHSIPFSYQLPSNIPSSFKGDKGTISYSIIVRVLMTGFTNQEITKDFDVVSPADLNQGGDNIKVLQIYIVHVDRVPERLPIAAIPPATPPPPYESPQMPPPYIPNVPNVQICPPGPVLFPTVANVVDKSLAYGSKSSPLGAFEIGFRPPGNSSMPVPSHPYPDFEDQMHQRPDLHPYPEPAASEPYSGRPSAPPPP